VEFPETLPVGQYVLEVTIGAGGKYTKTFQTVLQVSDVSAFVSTSEEKAVVWVNDVAGKQPIRDAEVVWSDGDVVLGRTNEQGLLTVDTPNALRAVTDVTAFSFLKVRQGESHDLIMPIENNANGTGWWYRTPTGDNYWSYLSFDRELYQPTDTVGFWGVVRDRKQMNRAVPLVLVAIHDGDEVWRQEITPSKIGTFTGEMKMENWDTGSYQFEVRAGETVIITKYVDVQTYSKPAYRLSLEANRKAIFTGETVTLNGQASFFEGTPVPQANILVTADDSSNLSAPEQTDKQGQFAIGYTPKELKKDAVRYGNSGSQQSIDAASTEAEEGDISTSAFVRVFGSRLSFALDDTTIHDGRATFGGTVHQVALDRLNDGTAKNSDDYLGAVQANQKVRVRATRTVWEKVEKGEEYDFIEKRVMKRYDWKSREENLDDTTVMTDSQGRFAYQPNIDTHSMFRVTFETIDDRGNAVNVTDYAYGDESATSDTTYALRDRLDESKDGAAKNYHIGDAMQLALTKGGQSVESGEGRRFLYMREQNGIREAVVSDQSEYATTFGEGDVPNVFFSGVYFTGETYVIVSDFSAIFERDDRKLTVELTPDRSTYRPRDEVRVRVKTTDPEGKPKPAEVNLSVVDEALFALAEQYVDPLTVLYNRVGSGVLSTYASHQYPEATQLAEMGGGGDGRSVFPDRVFFGSVMTDANGQGEFVFKVPDNLTSWRLTAQGMSGDLFAGNTKGTIAVKQPFFVDAVLAKDYVESDKPIVSVRAYGEELNPGQDVHYTVTGDESSGFTKQMLTGKAFESTDVVLPQLSEGKHTLTIEGISGDLQDKLTRSFSVVKTRLDKQQTKFVDVKSDTVIDGSDTGRTRIVLSDAGRGQWYADLVDQALTASDRIDRRLAREQSKRLLQTYFNEGIDVDPIDWRVYQDADGGVKLFSFGQSDFGLSVRVAFAQPEGVDVPALTRYLQSFVDENVIKAAKKTVTSDEQTQALAALGALHQPVLLDLQKHMEDETLSVDARLAVGVGLAILGDEDSARKVYASLEKKTQLKNGERWLESSDDSNPNGILVTTATLAELSGLLGVHETPAYVRYLDQHPSKEISVDLERIVALAPTLSQITQSTVSFDYTLNGQTIRKTVEKNEIFTLSLSPEERRALNIRTISGSLGAVVSFSVPWQVADETHSAVSVEREFSVDGKKTTDWHVGDRVRVTLRPKFRADAPDGCYRVTDALPSGLKVLTATPWAFSDFDWNENAIWYPYAITGQKVNFCVTKDMKKPIVYSARVVNKGVFTAEGAVIQSEKDPDSTAVSATQTVNISE
jgi:uncharacterized protein YfaS (alpha-2-macroglobulin family)